eukprot:TRINITY_DN2201_c0_g1_i16.p2 TRINITY_DN2201_c0_g1~~TRINITY_DN2201_c0_g1_i16.p2  ORF type:complete len:370 (+),score=92.00 TRINITY_DN2201_c0_g1_i16:1783-2892(+)
MHDMFANELKSGVHRMLRANLLELRENLCHLTPSPDLIQELHDGMPVESITAHEGVPADSTRLKLLLDFSVGRILLLEAPERNPETQAWHAEVLAKLATAPMEVVVPSTIKWLLGRVHGIKLEVAVIQARVLLKEHGVEYERSLAASAIADGSLDLADTQAWVAQQAEALEEMRIAPSVSTVVLAGLVSLICSPSPLQGLPQLLALDAARIHQLHDQVNRTIQLQVILLALKPAASSVLVEEQAYKLLLQHATETTAQDALRVALLATEQLMLAADEELLRRMAKNSVDPKDPVHKLIRRRLTSVLMRSLVQAHPLQAGGLHSQGILYATDQLQQICQQVKCVADRNGEIYGPLVAELLQIRHFDREPK